MKSMHQALLLAAAKSSSCTMCTIVSKGKGDVRQICALIKKGGELLIMENAHTCLRSRFQEHRAWAWFVGYTFRWDGVLAKAGTVAIGAAKNLLENGNAMVQLQRS